MSKLRDDDREAFRTFDELHGKNDIDAITRALDAIGLVDIDVWEAKREKTRKRLGRYRRYWESRQDGAQMELVNLVETVTDPETGEAFERHYYRRLNELVMEEGVQCLTTVYRTGRRVFNKFHRYYKPLRRKFGRDLQMALSFPIPPQDLPIYEMEEQEL